jgi:hypothetical protein
MHFYSCSGCSKHDLRCFADWRSRRRRRTPFWRDSSEGVFESIETAFQSSRQTVSSRRLRQFLRPASARTLDRRRRALRSATADETFENFFLQNCSIRLKELEKYLFWQNKHNFEFQNVYKECFYYRLGVMFAFFSYRVVDVWRGRIGDRVNVGLGRIC